MTFRLSSISLVMTILCLFVVLAEDASCFYPSKKHDGEIVFFDNCGEANALAGLSLAPKHFGNISFNTSELACVVFSGDDTFLVRSNGQSVRILFYDNWCDYFEEGPTRAMLNGRMVFVDKQLDTVLDPGFDLVGRFAEGFALACNGPFTYEQQGEHELRKGGKCGLINRSGELVIELKHPIENRHAFRDDMSSQKGIVNRYSNGYPQRYVYSTAIRRIS